MQPDPPLNPLPPVEVLSGTVGGVVVQEDGSLTVTLPDGSE